MVKSVQRRIARKEEPTVQKYKITLFYDDNDKLIGALIETPRTLRRIYIALDENVKVKLPKSVKKVLLKYGFKIS